MTYRENYDIIIENFLELIKTNRNSFELFYLKFQNLIIEFLT